jgi:hypothetical protein
MALTKEEQKAASQRIMAKLGPLDAQEQETYDLLTRNPKQYIPPSVETGERTCGVCGKKFQDREARGVQLAMTALDQFADHMTDHNPSPAQWGTAHDRIQAVKERAKNT